MQGLRVQNLIKHYQEKAGLIKAVDGVSFDVPFGSIMALLGPNGSGKTTTLDCLVGLTKPDQGSITLVGRDDTLDRPAIGCISSKSEYYWMFTGRQILLNYRRLLGVSDNSVNNLVSHFGLSDRLGRKWHQYSSGEQMRFRIIIALLNDPAVLVLDEPTIGLDPLVAGLLREELRKCRDSGKAIILTSHHMNDINELADTVYFLKKGRVIRNGTLESFKQPKKLVAVQYDDYTIKADWSFDENRSAFIVPIADLALALQIGSVKAVVSLEENLEDYFRELSTED